MLDEKSILDLEGERAKSCPKCGGTEWYTKPAERRKLAHNGKRYYAKPELVCVACKRARWKRYYEANRTKVLRKNREWLKAHPEKHTLYKKRWRRKQT